MSMELKSLDQIFEKIDAPVDDADCREFIDDELMKLGTLQHGEID